MVKVQRKSKLRSLSLVLGAVLVLGGIAFAGATFGKKPVVAADTPTGDVKSVIVQFKNAQAVTSSANVQTRQAAIESANSRVFEAIPYSTGFKQKTQDYDNLPYAVYVVDQEGEASLKADPNVATVRDEKSYSPTLQQVVNTVGGSTSTGFTDTSGTYTGNGTAIAILDSGVRSDHAMLSGKVTAEACFGVNQVYTDATVESFCPGGATTATGTGTGAPCGGISSCFHGTHVASIAAGKTTSATFESTQYTLAGVAKGADIIAIQVFSKVTSATACPVGTNPCILAFESSVAGAADYLINLKTNNTLGKPIVAANMSLGGGAYDNAATCEADAPLYTQAVQSLYSSGIAPIISNGNDGAKAGVENKIANPACITNAIAVGATNKAGTTMAAYSQNNALTDILAPGGNYDGSNASSVIIAATNTSTTAVAPAQGTSMAAPMVAGAFAVVREKHPKATIPQVLTLLQSSGVNVTESRSGYTPITKKRINVANALTQSPYATISTFTGPTGTVNEGQAITLNATVANATSCSLNNGVGNVAITSGAISVSVPGAASYTLTCLNAYGDSVSLTRTFTTNPAPTAPTITQQTYNESAKTFTLTWDASTDSDGIEEYQVFLNGQQVATLPAGTTTYTFENLAANVAYTAEVRAVDTLGAISSAASATFGGSPTGTDPVPGTPNTGAQSLVDGMGAKGIAVAILGVIAALAILVTVMKRKTR